MRSLHAFLLLALLATSAFAQLSDSDTDVSLSDSASDAEEAAAQQQEQQDDAVAADDQQEEPQEVAESANEQEQAEEEQQPESADETFEQELNSMSDNGEDFGVEDEEASALPDFTKTVQLILESSFYKDDSMGYDASDEFRAAPGCAKKDFKNTFLRSGKVDAGVWSKMSTATKRKWADCFVSFATMRRDYKNKKGNFLFTRGSKGGFLFTRRDGGGFLFTKGDNGGFLFTKKEGGGFLFSRGDNGGFLFTGKKGGFLFTRGDNAGFLFSHKSGHGFLFKKGAGVIYGSKKGKYTYGGKKTGDLQNVDTASLEQYADEAMDSEQEPEQQQSVDDYFVSDSEAEESA